MDEVEEAGLRAFALSVGIRDDGHGMARPDWVDVGGIRVHVEELEATWREEERAGFRVRLADGSHWLLYYVPQLKLWSGVLNGRSPEDP